MQHEKTMYGLCDCNNFFASCERVFRPELEGLPVDRARHARLMDAMDATNRTYGRNRVVVAAQGFAPLKMNRQHLSQEYTTDWKQIITVKAD